MDFQSWPLGAPANPWRNLRVFSVSPNWSGGLLESLSWLTDVMVSERAVEQRRTVRRWPRRMIECSFLRKGAYRSRLDSFMAGTGRELFLVPLWHEQFFLNDPTDDGNVYFPAGTLAMREYRLGDLVMVSLIAKDPNTYAVLQVIEYDEAGDRIKLAAIEDTGLWPIGSRITPLRRARILDSVTQNGLTDDVATAQIRFTLYDPDKYFTASWGTGDRFWPFKADRATPFVFDYNRQSYTQDFDMGLIDVVDPSNQAQVTQSMMMTLFGRKNVYAFRSFLYAARGKAIRFYVPTGMSDLQLTTNLGGTTFETKQNGLSEYMLLPQECRELIEISYTDGRQKSYRRIVGVQAVYDDMRQVGEQITVDQALPSADLNLVSRISYVVPSRFNSDLFEFSHKVDDSAAVQVAVSMVSAIQAGMPPLPPDPPTGQSWHFIADYTRAQDVPGVGTDDIWGFQDTTFAGLPTPTVGTRISGTPEMVNVIYEVIDYVPGLGEDTFKFGLIYLSVDAAEPWSHFEVIINDSYSINLPIILLPFGIAGYGYALASVTATPEGSPLRLSVGDDIKVFATDDGSRALVRNALADHEFSVNGTIIAADQSSVAIRGQIDTVALSDGGLHVYLYYVDLDSGLPLPLAEQPTWAFTDNPTPSTLSPWSAISGMGLPGAIPGMSLLVAKGMTFGDVNSLAVISSTGYPKVIGVRIPMPYVTRSIAALDQPYVDNYNTPPSSPITLNYASASGQIVHDLNATYENSLTFGSTQIQRLALDSSGMARLNYPLSDSLSVQGLQCSFDGVTFATDYIDRADHPFVSDSFTQSNVAGVNTITNPIKLNIELFDFYYRLVGGTEVVHGSFTNFTPYQADITPTLI